MSVSKILDVVIGIVFVFFVFSTLASGIHEVVTRALATRSKQLWRALATLLDGLGDEPDKTQRAATIAFGLNGARDPRPSSQPTTAPAATNVQRLFAHDLINGIDDTTQLPKTRLSHIEPELFSRALLDLISDNSRLENTADAREAVDNLPESRLKDELQALVRHAGAEIEQLRADIAGWFDIRMEALSRAYRRRTRWWLFVVGVIVAVGLNVDAVRVVNRFYEDDATRTLISAEAESLAESCEFSGGEPDAACKANLEAASDALKLPVWWGQGESVNGLTLLGWAIAAAAISQGAPFWFDVLRRVAGFKRGAISST